jgi:hypothetical protein
LARGPQQQADIIGSNAFLFPTHGRRSARRRPQQAQCSWHSVGPQAAPQHQQQARRPPPQQQQNQ